jgi:hypothetical protein
MALLVLVHNAIVNQPKLGTKVIQKAGFIFETLFTYLDKPKSDSSDDEDGVNEWFSRAMTVTISRSSQSFELLYG